MIDLLEKLNQLATECGKDITVVFEKFAAELRKECGVETDPAKKNGWAGEGEEQPSDDVEKQEPAAEGDVKTEDPAEPEAKAEAKVDPADSAEATAEPSDEAKEAEAEETKAAE